MNIKRRVTEAVLEGVGKAKKSDDSAFDARKARIFALEDVLKRYLHAVGQFTDHTRGLCFACAQIGDATRTLYVDCDPTQAGTVEAFAEGMCAQDSGLRKSVDEGLVNHVLDPLNAALKVRSPVESAWPFDALMHCCRLHAAGNCRDAVAHEGAGHGQARL
jgi:hypothetical protein